MVLNTIIAALIATGVFSGVGAFFLFLNEERIEGLLSYMISLSAGTIFGGVFKIGRAHV